MLKKSRNGKEIRFEPRMKGVNRVDCQKNVLLSFKDRREKSNVP